MYIYEQYIILVYIVIAGSLESANSSILAAHRHFKEVVGKKSGFYVNEFGQSQ